MDLFVDDEMIDPAFLGERATVEEVLQQVQANLCDSGRVVVALQGDGREVEADAMADMLKQPAINFARLDVVTGTQGDLVVDAMDQASVCLQETEEACMRAADMLTEGKTVEAARTLAECLRVWQPIHESVSKSIEMLQLDPERATIHDESLVELIAKPKGVLLQVRDALRMQDFVMLADLLQYEFDDVMQSWHSIVSLLRQEAQARSTKHHS